MGEITGKSWAAVVVLALIWGGSFMATKIALTGTGPFFLASVRLTLAAVFLVSWAMLRGPGLPPLRGKGKVIWGFALALACLSNFLPFTLLSWAQQFVASGFAGVTMAMVPLFILPLAHLLVPGEAMNLRRFIGFVLGAVGVIVLIGPEAMATTGKDMENTARLACVLVGLFYALGAICTRLCPEVPGLSLAAAVMLLASLISMPVALSIEGPPADTNGGALLAMLYLGLLPTGIAQVILVYITRTAGPIFFGLVQYQVPVWSIILGVVFLAEPLPPTLLLGLALILCGVALSQYGALKRLFR